MQRDTDPGRMPNCSPRFFTPQPVARIAGPAHRIAHLHPSLARSAEAATPFDPRPGYVMASKQVAPPVYRPRMDPLAVQPKMPVGTAMRPPAPPVYRLQQRPIVSQTRGPSIQPRTPGNSLQPFLTGVIQAKKFCDICK